MIRFLFAIACILLAQTRSIGSPQSEPSTTDEQAQTFERKIRPILAERCYSCHSAEAKVLHGGLRLDTSEGFQFGGDSGPVFDAAEPLESLFVRSIRFDQDIQMPPKGKLPDHEIEALTAWARNGAPYPKSLVTTESRPKTIDYEEGKRFWSFQPLAEPATPVVRNPDWLKTRTDAFLLSAMEREGLTPSVPAERDKLLRRLSFDLLGLPPSQEEVQAFVMDDSPQAFDNVLDRYMASPQYGEKWARMWLDLARYCDRTEDWLGQEGQAYFYRDWIVHAWNHDLPYDDFVRKQIAADLMPDSRLEDLPALGFVGLSPNYFKELMLPTEIIKLIVADEWEERVDAFSSTFLGLNVACARCHNHKSDPISSEDYYALAGVFASSRQIARPMIADEKYQPVRDAKAEIVKLESEITKLKAEIAKQEADRKAKENAPKDSVTQEGVAVVSSEPTEPLEPKLERATLRIQELKQTPFFDLHLACALSEESLSVERAGATPQEGTKLNYRAGAQDLPVFVRGDPNRPGEIVPRRFLKVLAKENRPFEVGSGRLELAQAVTSDAAPLAARVIVNRIWLAHFGQGLVNTPSNFGTQGGRPSHPELLEDLAFRFVRHGWSIKWLHRELLSSAAWQQSAQPSEEAKASDPGNRWLSHMNRRRLDFEAWRDSMLVATDGMDSKAGGLSVNLDESANHRRTLYCTVHRRELSTTYQIHDFPDPNQHSSQRFTTTTALQGLYALNGPLLSEQSKQLARRLAQEFSGDDASQIRQAYWLLFSRAPTETEVGLGQEYLADSAGEERANRWKQYAHILLASNEFLFLD